MPIFINTTHSAFIGHCIVGDEKYGDFELNKKLRGRMYLHAQELKIKHPASGEVLSLVSELPTEFVQFIVNHAVIR